jgi:hypothetical protein
MGWFAIGWVARGQENRKYAESRLRHLAAQAVASHQAPGDTRAWWDADRVVAPIPALPPVVNVYVAAPARAAAAAGFRVEGMWANSDGSGRTEYHNRKGRSNKGLRAALVATIAGQEAEIRYLMETQDMRRGDALKATHAGAASNRAAFTKMAQGTGYSWEGLRDEARRFVRWNWYTIETNAKPLARRGRRGGTWA